MQFTMTSVLALAIAATGASAAFTTPCNAPYDVCGWTLTSGQFSMFLTSNPLSLATYHILTY